MQEQLPKSVAATDLVRRTRERRSVAGISRAKYDLINRHDPAQSQRRRESPPRRKIIVVGR